MKTNLGKTSNLPTGLQDLIKDKGDKFRAIPVVTGNIWGAEMGWYTLNADGEWVLDTRTEEEILA